MISLYIMRRSRNRRICREITVEFHCRLDLWAKTAGLLKGFVYTHDKQFLVQNYS